MGKYQAHLISIIKVLLQCRRTQDLESDDQDKSRFQHLRVQRFWTSYSISLNFLKKKKKEEGGGGS